MTELEPVSFTATVPLEPTVDLGAYRDIRVESDPVEVTDEEVDGVLDRVRDEQAVWEPVDRAAEYGDRLKPERPGNHGRGNGGGRRGR